MRIKNKLIDLIFINLGILIENYFSNLLLKKKKKTSIFIEIRINGLKIKNVIVF